MLDLKQLETFQTVARTNSFTKAAEVLGYSQSSVTGHIKALERELGAPLFDRTRFSKSISLTQAGEQTLQYAARLLALAEETKAAVPLASSLAGVR